MKQTRQFMKTVLAMFFGLIGSGVLQFGIALYILRQTGSSLSFATTMLIGPIVSVIFTPLVGYTVDRYRRKNIVGWSQLISIVTLIVFAVLFTRVSSILQLVIPVLVILKIADIFFSAAYVASVRGIVLDHQINRLQSFISGFQSVAGIISPILGAALYALFRMPVYIGLVAVFELLALLINLSIDFQFNPVSHHTDTTGERNVWQSFKLGLAYIKHKPDLIRMAFVAMLVNFLLVAQSVGVPASLVNLFHLNDAQYGFAMMAGSIGVLATSLIYGLINHQPKRPLVVLYYVGIIMGTILGLLSLPGFLGFSRQQAFYYFFGAMFLSGATAALVNIPMMGYMQRAVEEDYKGRVFTLFGTLATALTPISILIYGYLFDRFSSNWLFLITGLILVSSLSLIWLNTPHHIHREEDHDLSREPL